MIDAQASGTMTEHLSRLLYELLDAHVGTIKLAEDMSENQRWAAHLEYLRGLQRVGRETLARTG